MEAICVGDDAAAAAASFEKSATEKQQLINIETIEKQIVTMRTCPCIS